MGRTSQFLYGLFRQNRRGLVPGPTAADIAGDRILRADRSWVNQPSGTVPSVTGKAGYYLTNDGSNAAWSSNPVQQFLNRQGAPQIISDGATTNRAIVQPGSTRTNLAGAPVATWCGLVYVPTSNPSASAQIFQRASAISDPTAQTWSISGRIRSTDGALVVQANGTTTSDQRAFTWASFRSTYSGQWVWLEVYLVNGTTNPVVRVNDLDVSSSFTAATVGTPPDWLASSLVDTYFLTGYNWPAGPAPIGEWGNAALSDADRAYWRITGQPPKWWVDGGSQVGLTASNWSFETGTGSPPANWGDDGNHVATALADGTAPDGANVMEIVASGAGAWTGNAVYSISSVTRTVGNKYVVRFWAKSISGSTNLSLNGNAIGSFILTTGWVQYTSNVYVATSGGTITPAFYLNAAGTVRIDKVEVFQLGSLGSPIQGPDRTVRDGTRMTPAVDGYMVGMSPLCTEADGWIRGRRTTDGYLQADTQLVGDGRGVVQVLLLSTSGGTVTLGDSAGAPATLVASVSLTAGVVTPCTILKSLTTGGKIYVDLGTATDVTIYVRTGPIAAFA